MPTYSWGLKSVKDSAIDPVTGLPTALTDIGKIYRDSGEFTVEDATVTNHFAELDDEPVVSVSRKGVKMVRLRLMDTSNENLAKWIGGEITEVEGEPPLWNEPDGTTQLERAFEFEMEDGTIKGIRRGKVEAKHIIDPKRTGFSVIELMITPLKPLVAGLTATYKKAAPVPAP
jgi:hypothetical protein